ncbi:anhydro-N-acetylmuramic acid kinase [Thermomonas sp.]|uniref:anhydro-N-acetylmuramic acid kinase n=1 Tax=Thermomonas sp. TaxID=1971895 RepID=UPI0024872EA5|nr:anhydro-N-acetylmuramic acid kinase [Thermomonas sp.]MDI1252465.1 anhydro-N-acetylmuramic acid kinase [Thermomonas sp.]
MSKSASQQYFLGLISGTSADGIDAALVRFADDDAHATPELVFGLTDPWEPALRSRLLALGQHAMTLTLDEVGELDVRIGRAFAKAAQAAIEAAGIDRNELVAIGSHGQTLRHRPHGEVPFTLQLGDPSSIAEHCSVQVVADFRRRDVAAGGHGAPLVPAFHAATLHSDRENRAALNLGGIANFTLLPKHGAVRGFDTGPANGLMDAWCLRHTGKPYDAGGEFAAQGCIDEALLARLLDEPWFALPPPKSTGRDQFHLAWVESKLTGDEAPADVQATLMELSVRTIVDALRVTQPDTQRVIACGGGVHNDRLMAALGQALPDVIVESSAAHGLDPDFVEAIAFAWLARETLAGRPGNLPAVTGAAGLRVLGAVYPA